MGVGAGLADGLLDLGPLDAEPLALAPPRPRGLVAAGEVEGGLVCAPRGGGIRLSTHVFNDASDIERAMAAVDALKVRPLLSSSA